VNATRRRRSANPRDHRVNAAITADGSPQTVSPSTTVPTKLGTVAGDGTSNDADDVQGLIAGWPLCALTSCPSEFRKPTFMV
jgi:hypothetical protein